MKHFLSYPFSPMLLCFAIAMYGLFGSPTPDQPGWVEILVALFLMGAVGVRGAQNIFDVKNQKSFFLQCIQIFFLTGLIVPLMSGVIAGNDRILMARDIAAFMFLGLPLFFYGRLDDVKIKHGLSFLLMCVGVVFCLRTLIPVFNVWIPQGELLYLSNSPLVMMASIFIGVFIWQNLPNIFGLSWLKTFGMMALVAVMMAAMLMDVQRATIGAVILSIGFMVVIDIWQRPRRAVFSVIILAVCLMFIFPVFEQALSAMAHKTAQVGMNARMGEMAAVYSAISQDIFGWIFGKGWGATFSSPAVAGLEVNYTHSLLTTMMLKGGMVMLVAGIVMVMSVLYEIFLIFQRDKVWGLALFWSFSIPVFLYASHKSLDFGLVLLMIGMWNTKPRHGQNIDVRLDNK